MFESYHVFFELPEIEEGEKYTLEIKSVSQPETVLGKVVFTIK